MSDAEQTLCKVLVHEAREDQAQIIRQFCEANNLIPLRCKDDTLFDVLKSNVDLGAIFLSESSGENFESGVDLCHQVHKLRPELPIFFKYDSALTEEENDQVNQLGLSYDINKIDELRSALDLHIFSKKYPNELLRGINDIAIESLSHIFDNVSVQSSSPYIVKDRIIYGELFSLIPIDSKWCRGYMMLQTSEDNILDWVGSASLNEACERGFREVNDVLSEITNMMWGGIKSRFIAVEESDKKYSTQVPIIVNHSNRYISFGSDTPQLCFKFHVKQDQSPNKEIVIFAKFVFSLSWDPEQFSAGLPTVEDFVDSGELEFF